MKALNKAGCHRQFFHGGPLAASRQPIDPLGTPGNTDSVGNWRCGDLPLGQGGPGIPGKSCGLASCGFVARLSNARQLHVSCTPVEF